METIICDNFSESAQNRFPSGLKMDVILGGNEGLPAASYEVQNLTCCSAVRNTSQNWFYLIPGGTDLEYLKTWIAELNPVFKNLNMSIISIDKNKLRYKKDNTNFSLSLRQKNDAGELIEMPIELSDASNNHYGITNKAYYKTGKLSNINFLMELFCNYCIDNNINNYDNPEEIIVDFVENLKKKPIITETNDFVNLRISPGTFSVTFRYIVDFNSISIETLIDYIYNIFLVNTKAITQYILKYLHKETSLVNFLQVFYSKKTSNIQGYLAHHLIRAGFSEEFKPFIDQYFTIKKQLPDIGFWNLIFYTQFGFKFYFYYWLTSNRIFRNISDEEMATAIRVNLGSSSKDFLQEFALTMSLAVRNRAVNMYIAGNFLGFHRLMMGSVSVELVSEAKKRFQNLRLSPFYTVTSDDDKYYFIIGDDYRLHRYSKKYFKTL